MANSDVPTNAAYAFQYYVKAGVPPQVAAGMVGSLMQESTNRKTGDIDPGAVNPSSGAYGVAQFLGDRKAGYLAYAKSQGKDPGDLTTQLDYTMIEANKGEGGAWTKLWNAKDPGEAAVIASQAYERPGADEANNGARVANAQRIYAAMTAPGAPQLYAEPPKAEKPPADPTSPDANLDWLQTMVPTEKAAPDTKAAPDVNLDWLASQAPTAKPKKVDPVDKLAAAIGGAAGKIGDGAMTGVTEGFGSGPLLDTNYWQSSPDAPGYSKALDTVANHTIGPVLSLAGRGLNALTGGVQGGLYEAGNLIDPSGRLGADAAAMVTAPPIPELNMLAAARGTVPRATVAADQPAIPPRAEPLRIEPAMTRPALPAPGPAGMPQNLSAAATPQELATMSPAELAAAEAGDNLKRLSEGGKTMDPSGEVYVPGSVPLKGEYSTNTADAIQHRAAMSSDPEYAHQVTQHQAGQNEARLNYFGDMAGSPETVQAKTAMLSDEFDKGLKTVFADKKPADASPVVATINGILDGPDGKRAAVEKAMESVSASLKNRKTGELETDPEMLYGVRQHINDITSPEALREAPMSAKAVAALMEVKASLDAQIEAAAPGFGELMKQYAAQKAPIDAMEYLQGKLPSLMNQGVLSAAKFRNFMRSIYEQRKAGGILPATKLSPEQLTALWNIDKDLQRSTRLMGGMPGGSNTAQNLASFAKSAVETGLRTGAAHMTAGMSELAMPFIKGAVKSNKTAKLRNYLLEPPKNGAE